MSDRRPMVLSYGMGVESTAILLHWLVNPESRRFSIQEIVRHDQAEAPKRGRKSPPPSFRPIGEDSFDLSDLIVVTAMTGDEFPDLQELLAQHILPRMADAGVRYVQVARKSKQERMTVLDDTRSPRELHLRGAYKLSDELLTAGTVPQVAKSKRLCSIKAKGWPLDAWIEQEMGSRDFYQALGFNSEEATRVIRDLSYSAVQWPPGQKTTIYPLMWDWNWTRDACIDFIREVTGVEWPKSACCYCPFSAGKDPVLVRFNKYPDAAAFSLMIERISLGLNPRMGLYGDTQNPPSRGSATLLKIVQDVGDHQALNAFESRLDAEPWAIYSVRRIYTAKPDGKKGVAYRSVKIIAQGSRREMEDHLPSYGEITMEGGVPRVYLLRRRQSVSQDRRGRSIPADVYPAAEEFVVASPATVPDKEASTFERYWQFAGAGDWEGFQRAKDRGKSRTVVDDDEADDDEITAGYLAGAGASEVAYDDDMSDLTEIDPDRDQQNAWEDAMGDILAPNEA